MYVRWKKPQYRIEIDRKHVAGASWFWRIISVANGQTVATSETYSSRDACTKTALAVAVDAGWWTDEPVIVNHSIALGEE